MAPSRTPRLAEEAMIAAWLAQYSATTKLDREPLPAVTVEHRKFGRPKKPGPRYASGDLRRESDRGTKEQRQRRSEMVGPAPDTRTPQRIARHEALASYPLGILYARRKILRDDHYAGRRYTGLFVMAVRPITIASTLSNLVAGGGLSIVGIELLADGAERDRAAEARTDYLDAREVMSPIEANTVDAICVYEDEMLLRRILDGRAPKMMGHLESGLDKLFRHFEAADKLSRAARAR